MKFPTVENLGKRVMVIIVTMVTVKNDDVSDGHRAGVFDDVMAISIIVIQMKNHNDDVIKIEC